jgi:hypothetical protein
MQGTEAKLTAEATEYGLKISGVPCGDFALEP